MLRPLTCQKIHRISFIKASDSYGIKTIKTRETSWASQNVPSKGVTPRKKLQIWSFSVQFEIYPFWRGNPDYGKKGTPKDLRFGLKY